MVYTRFEALCENGPKPISLGWATAIVVAFCALGVRAVESSGDTIGFMRILVSAFALGTFFIVRRFSIAKGVTLALAIEVVSGSALFAMVDYPFVMKHGPELGRMTVTTLERFERRSVRATERLAKA